MLPVCVGPQVLHVEGWVGEVAYTERLWYETVTQNTISLMISIYPLVEKSQRKKFQKPKEGGSSSKY